MFSAENNYTYKFKHLKTLDKRVDHRLYITSVNIISSNFTITFAVQIRKNGVYTQA